MITREDKEFLQSKGVTEATLLEQLDMFKSGFPFLRLSAAGSVKKGIITMEDADRRKSFLNAWEKYKATQKKVLKFVPASGAASRMFKQLFEFLDGAEDFPQGDFMTTFFEKIENFAFYNKLNEMCESKYHLSVKQLIEKGEYKKIIAELLLDNGLNYGALPKGLLLFHKYKSGPRTPVEEHLVEGALYAMNSDGHVYLHFTVSPEHLELFKELVEKCTPALAKKYGLTYHVDFSTQKSSTDTVAVDMENNPFRTADGKLLFRPGGHGALIENLNEQDADIIFIKNIDNVVPDRLKDDTVLYKCLIAGVLVQLQQKVFEYLHLLDNGKYTHEQLVKMLNFLEDKLCCTYSPAREMSDKDLADYLRRKFNRPMRVCGMVKNVGEPGGGPFLAYNADGSVSLQILESSQIDMKDAAKKEMFENGTHFNPVDLVCGVKDYKGNKFDLTQFVDKNTGFISYKSKDGRELKALELPGLWNGAMSDWNTIFVEVPLSTFNPVKTVNDLLRPEHQ